MKTLTLTLILILTAQLPAFSLAQTPPSGGPYALPKQVIASGGARASAGSFVLTGTAGQAATTTASGGSYVVQGGFYQAIGTPSVVDTIFKNGFEN